MTDAGSTDELVALISRSLFAAFLRGAEQWAQLNVTMPQLKILLLLGLHGSLPVSTLAHQMHVSPPNVTGILDRLELQRWVRRTSDPHDRRIVRVVLTAEGEQFLASLEHASAAGARVRLDEMHPEDRLALSRGLRALLGALVSAPEPERALAATGAR